jgi:hypothetical protein
VGSDDQAKLYLNGQEIHRYVRARSWEPDQDEVPVELKRGINVLVFKVVNELFDWKASIRITAAADQPVNRVRVTLDPNQ